MNNLKKRLLLSLSAAALAMPMAAGSVQAIEVVVLDQVNDATQSAELSFEALWGESLAATAAAIGNSAAFNVEGAADAGALDLAQINDGDVGLQGNQLADIYLHDVDLTSGVADGVALTAAAIGNTLSGTGEGTILDIDLEQVNGQEGEGILPEGQYANIVLEEVVISGLESTLSAAAIGNSASLTAGAIGTSDGFDTVSQANYGAQGAHVHVTDLVMETTADGAVFDATAAALGNSLTLTAETGDLFLDTVVQDNLGDEIGLLLTLNLGQYAGVHLYSLNDVETPATPVGVDAPTFETFDSTVVAAAIGNSASFSAGGNVLLDEIVQNNEAFQIADVVIAYSYGLADLTATAVAIGNSLSITSGGDFAFDKVDGGIFQENAWVDWDGDAQNADHLLQDLNVNGDLALTAAAIGNSLSLDADGGFAFGTDNVIEQANLADQDSEIELDDIWGLEDVSGTVVAIGNSLSLGSGGDFSFGSYGSIAQMNDAYQDADIELGNLNAAGDVELTVAAIGNSLSLTAEGALSGVGAEISQENNYGQAVELSLNGTVGSFTSLDATAVAIGNSLSLTAGSFEGTGTLAVAQNNFDPQTVSLGLSDAGLGALSSTTAAIGNSASVTIK
ncbi:hypothetical protein [Marinimicrococcus flavescens]|uniref:Uncharacterized protein n=1 Tax=Marinimicrococcus flavescens TaxID=3031815 RepID=A0AAP3UY45_9PROT|nr:hypothetical protein [Marinimicrococcus flavescens]